MEVFWTWPLKPTISNKIQSVTDPVIPWVANLASTNHGTISLGQGIVFYPPPLSDPSLFYSLDFANDMNRYGPVRGIPELVEAYEAKLKSDNQATLDGNSLFITAGSNMAFQAVVLAIADVGDEIIILKPYYFNHEMAIRIAGAIPIECPTDFKYHPDMESMELAITPRTRAIVTISPNNPTGAVYTREELIAINEMCAKHGIFHIHDEAYEYFNYTGEPTFSPCSISGAEEHTISLFSLSKSFGMAGWRIGALLAPNSLNSAMLRILDTMLICAPVASQRLAVRCLAAGKQYCESFLEEIMSSRKACLQALDGMSGQNELEVANAEGAFYLFLKLHCKHPPLEIVKYLVEQHRVAVVPGVAFGDKSACSLRVSYGALNGPLVSEGIHRLRSGIVDVLNRGSLR